jgi:hypothetical protein
MGILRMVGLAATLALAVPAASFGLAELSAGRPIGAVFLGLAAALLVAEWVLTTPGDLPGAAVERVAGAVVGDPDAGEDPE